ncbi:MAG: DUF4270 domain-containing protein [Candidatus Azobacteroides sp.]|nr:DUF4270 domain-containing protein [Candidatus Azobacteroides sp.]
MRFKLLICAIFTLGFIACEDDLSPVGMSIQPKDDRIDVYTDTVSFTSSTQLLDSIFIKTVAGSLGNFDDPTYGNIKCGYLCNFYTSPDSVFRPIVNEDKIDSVILNLYYSSYVGDSLAPMEATVYEVTDTLRKNFYSNVDPRVYTTNNKTILAKKTYTARNMNVPDSLNSTLKTLSIKLPVFVGDKIYKEWKDGNRDTFKYLENFFGFFPGIYIESTYGSGNILNITGTDMFVYYTSRLARDNGEIVPDSLACAYFPASPEVTQLNKFESKFDNQKLIDPNYTYLKTPAGVITQLEIPLQEIVNKVGAGRTFNNVKLALDVTEQPDIWDYTMSIPKEVVLISPDSVKPFFEKPGPEGKTFAYYASLTTSSAYKYDFGNIAALIQSSVTAATAAANPGEELKPLKLWVIPVETSTTNSTVFKNCITPSGARLKSGNNLKLYITTTKINK